MTDATKSCPHALPKRAPKALVQLPCTLLTKRAIKALVQLPHTLPKRAKKALVQAKRASKALALRISSPQASTQRRVPKVAKISGEMHLPDEDTSKEDAKGLKEDDWVTTDEDEDENEAEAEAAKARKRRSDSIVDVHSSSELKEGAKGPGSASKAENMEDETQGSSSEPKEIGKGSEASSGSKEAPQALSDEEIAEELHRERIARGKATHERLRDKAIADGSWASLSATFDRAANAPGAYKRIFNSATEDVTREPSPLLTHVRDKFKKAKPTAAPRISPDQRLVDPSSLAKEGSLESAPLFCEDRQSRQSQ